MSAACALPDLIVAGACQLLREQMSIQLSVHERDGKEIWRAERGLDHYNAVAEHSDPLVATLQCAAQILESGCSYAGRCGEEEK
jgi:hypothetical protein